jgi:hypothetical protein
MSRIFRENIRGLSAEYQRILLDDLVTAFQNRVNVLMRVQMKRLNESAKSGSDVEARISRVRELMIRLKPTKLRLKKGVLVRLDEELFVKKNKDGKIVVYEVAE